MKLGLLERTVTYKDPKRPPEKSLHLKAPIGSPRKLRNPWIKNPSRSTEGWCNMDTGEPWVLVGEVTLEEFLKIGTCGICASRARAVLKREAVAKALKEANLE